MEETNSSYSQESHIIEFTRKDRIFTFIIVGFFLVCFLPTFEEGFVISLESVKEFMAVMKPVILGLQIALLSTLTLACFYAYQISKKTSFYYLAYCWLAHTVYKIFTIAAMKSPSGNSQVILTAIIATAADLPLFLSVFPKANRKWWLPIIPIFTSVVIFYSILDAYLNR